MKMCRGSACCMLCIRPGASSECRDCFSRAMIEGMWFVEWQCAVVARVD
jgi:hypothetical protein